MTFRKNYKEVIEKTGVSDIDTFGNNMTHKKWFPSNFTNFFCANVPVHFTNSVIDLWVNCLITSLTIYLGHSSRERSWAGRRSPHRNTKKSDCSIVKVMTIFTLCCPSIFQTINLGEATELLSWCWKTGWAHDFFKPSLGCIRGCLTCSIWPHWRISKLECKVVNCGLLILG